MSARSIHKNLMRNCRVNSFWGRRALVPLRIPREFFPEKKPTFAGTLVENAGEQMLEGTWDLKNEDGTVTMINGGRVFCGVDPRIKDPDAVVYRLTSEGYMSFSWWEVSEHTARPDEWGYPDRNDENATLRNIGDEGDEDLKLLADVMIARKEWEKKYVSDYDGGWDPKFLELFHAAEYWSKTWYFDEDSHPDYYYIIFSVKWFYPNRRKRFCAAANRLLKYLKAKHSNAKIV